MLVFRKFLFCLSWWFVSAFVANTFAEESFTMESELAPFLGETNMEIQQIFKDQRFPNIVVGTDGTVLAFWNGVKLRRSKDGGQTWGEEILVGNGFMGGGVIVDETCGDILAFVEEHHPPASVHVYRSQDQGISWARQETVIHPDRKGNMPSMHMNEHGITLRHGQHKGRLIRPTRWYAGKNDRSKWPEHYTNAMFSDDGGKTWQTSEPFPANGTGEATLAELSDGTIYYNSRRHWAPAGENPLRRWTAFSEDGGATWTDLSICEVLPDGDQIKSYGLMGGLVRLPVKDRDVLIYSNIVSPEGRHHGTVWASFDGGTTWPIRRQVFEGAFAYSSLDVGRPGTSSEGWIYLQFEGGAKGGGNVARFNLAWLLEGESTGDGELPAWLEVKTKKYIIIHADDAGMSHSVNRATIDAMQNGSVSSASIMVPCPWFPEFAKFAKENPKGDYGIHLTLNAEWDLYRWGPVAGRDRVPSLVDENGFLWDNVGLVAEHAKAEEVEIELRAQIDRALAFGVPLSHLDTHMGSAFCRPDIAQVYVKLSLEYKLPVLVVRPTKTNGVAEQYPQIAKLLQPLEDAGMPILDEVYQFYTRGSYEERKKMYLDAIADAPNGVSEVIIHCGFDDPELQKITSSVDIRNSDRQIFSDPEVAAAIKRLGAEIITWKQFQEMQAERK